MEAGLLIRSRVRKAPLLVISDVFDDISLRAGCFRPPSPERRFLQRPYCDSWNEAILDRFRTSVIASSNDDPSSQTPELDPSETD